MNHEKPTHSEQIIIDEDYKFKAETLTGMALKCDRLMKRAVDKQFDSKELRKKEHTKIRAARLQRFYEVILDDILKFCKTPEECEQRTYRLNMYIARRAASNEEIGLIMQGLIEKKKNSPVKKVKGKCVNDTLTSDEADGKDSSPV